MAALRTELAGSAASPLEKLLVERVVLCWLQLHQAELAFAGATERTMAQGDYHQRREVRAQARYMAAIKALATVRKLVQPALSPLELATRAINEAPAKSCTGMPAGRRAPANERNIGHARRSTRARIKRIGQEMSPHH